MRNLIVKPRPNDHNIQRNISQHCWAQHVARVWPPCCDMLRVVGSSLKLVKFEPTTPNMSQHIATRWPNARNMLRPTMLRHVALASVGMLRSFSRGFTLKCCRLKPAVLLRSPTTHLLCRIILNHAVMSAYILLRSKEFDVTS